MYKLDKNSTIKKNKAKSRSLNWNKTTEKKLVLYIPSQGKNFKALLTIKKKNLYFQSPSKANIIVNVSISNPYPSMSQDHVDNVQ